MPIGDPYATLDELKTRLGIVDSTDDVRLSQALSATSYGVEKFAGRQFNRDETASARRYRAAGGGRLAFTDDQWDQVVVVVATDDDDDGSYETTWGAADFELHPLDGVADGRMGWPFSRVAAVGTRRFPTGRRAGVRVTASWGWLAVPAAVKEATLIVAEEVFKLADAPFGVAGFGEFGAMRVRMNSAAVTMLEPIRRYPVKVA